MAEVRVLPWLVELVRTLPALPAAYGPGAAIDPRSRQRVLVAVAEAHGCRWCAFVHGAWHTWLGDGAPGSDADVLLRHAHDAAAAGRPLRSDALLDELPSAAVRALRATVAAGTVSGMVGGAADRVVERVRSRGRPSPAHRAPDLAAGLADLVLVGAALPIAVPLVGFAAGMSFINRIVADPPVVVHRDGEEPNLLAHVIAGALPPLLAPTPARLAVRAVPGELVVGVTTGRSSATVRVSRGRVLVENGVAADAAVVVEGELTPLLGHAAGALVRDLATIRLRPT